MPRSVLIAQLKIDSRRSSRCNCIMRCVIEPCLAVTSCCNMKFRKCAAQPLWVSITTKWKDWSIKRKAENETKRNRFCSFCFDRDKFSAAFASRSPSPYLAQSADTFNYSNRLLLNNLFSNVWKLWSNWRVLRIFFLLVGGFEWWKQFGGSFGANKTLFFTFMTQCTQGFKFFCWSCTNFWIFLKFFLMIENLHK